MDNSKIAAEIAEYTLLTEERITNLTAENEGLRTKLAAQKEAGDNDVMPTFTKDSLDQTVHALVTSGHTKEAGRDQLLEDWEKDPNKALDFLVDLAKGNKKTASRKHRPLGKVSMDESTVASAPKRESDKLWEDKLIK